MCVEAELKRDVHEVVERCVNVLVRDAAARVALARGDDARLLFATEPSAKVCRPGASACDDHQDTDDECDRAMDRALSGDLLDTASGHSSAGRRRHLESLNSLSLDIVPRCVRGQRACGVSARRSQCGAAGAAAARLWAAEVRSGGMPCMESCGLALVSDVGTSESDRIRL